MMIKKPENIIPILVVCCAILVLATITRYFCLLSNLDLFTANVVFFIIIAFSLAVYISINSLIDNFLLPKVLSSKLFTRNRINTVSEDILNRHTNEEIRETFQKTSNQKKQKLVKQAIQYSREVLAPYTTDEELLRLYAFIEMYANGDELKAVRPIKVDKQLKPNDIYHYGWNIWNHFRITDQLSISHFLKVVFAPTLQDVCEIKTIKKKLKVPDSNSTIPIKYNLDS